MRDTAGELRERNPQSIERIKNVMEADHETHS